MATWADVRRLALALPETSEGVSWGSASWEVRGRGFVWERPLRRADLEHLGDAPVGPVLGAAVPDEGAELALVAVDPAVYFTTPHSDGYPAVLVRLEEIDVAELVSEAWLARAPRRLAQQHLAGGC
ncbi:MmcQ/YjbR family DNA-binding protein [Geodermatophilus sp. URMC 63]